MAGEYVLSLIAFDGMDWSAPDFITFTVRELQAPVAVIAVDVTNGPAPLTVRFDGSGSAVDPVAEPLTFTWSFDDGNFGSGAAKAHTYEIPGTYSASLTIVDSLGQSDVDSIEIIVTAPAVPSMHPIGLYVLLPGLLVGACLVAMRQG